MRTNKKMLSIVKTNNKLAKIDDYDLMIAHLETHRVGEECSNEHMEMAVWHSTKPAIRRMYTNMRYRLRRIYLKTGKLITTRRSRNGKILAIQLVVSDDAMSLDLAKMEQKKSKDDINARQYLLDKREAILQEVASLRPAKASK
jgi:hypothetical protein